MTLARSRRLGNRDLGHASHAGQEFEPTARERAGYFRGVRLGARDSAPTFKLHAMSDHDPSGRMIMMMLGPGRPGVEFD